MTLLRLALALILTLTLTFLDPCWAFSTGVRLPGDMAMSPICYGGGNFRPHHTDDPNKDYHKGNVYMPDPNIGAPPFEVLVTPNSNPYRPGASFDVRLRTKPGSAQKFKGFFLYLDGTGAQMSMVKGQWKKHPRDRANLAKVTKFCGDGMTHTSPALKDNVLIQFKLGPGNVTFGTLQFKATVVVNMSTFYLGVVSQPIRANSAYDTEVSAMRKQMNSMASQGGSGNFLSRMMSGMLQQATSAALKNRGGGQSQTRGGGGAFNMQSFLNGMRRGGAGGAGGGGGAGGNTGGGTGGFQLPFGPLGNLGNGNGGQRG